MNDDSWPRCDGQIQEMVASLRQKKRRRVLGNVAGTTFGLLLTVALVTTAISRLGQLNASPTAITCREAIQQFDDYRRDLLDSALAQRVSAHLEKCPSCRKAFEQGTQPDNGDAKNDSLDSNLVALLRSPRDTFER